MSNKSNSGSKLGLHTFSTVTSASLGTVTSVVLDAIVIAIFGMSGKTDAFFIANTIPLVFATILGLQATRVIQPIFLSKRETEGEAAGWNYLNLTMTSGTIITGVICAIGVFMSPMLIRLQAAGSPETGTGITLSIGLFVLLPLSFPTIVMRSVLRTFDMFAMPAASKLFENLAKIVFVVVLGRRLGLEALVVGVFVGTLWQIVMFYFILRRHGYRFKPVLGLKHPDMVQAYRLVSFQITGQVCSAGVDVVNNTLGSMLGAGNVTALRLATRVIESFAGLLPASVVEAAMPAVAASSARGDLAGTKKHIRHAFHLLLLVTVPLSVWLALTHREVIALLYQRGSFSNTDTFLVSNLLLLMIPYMFLGRLRSLFELPFFAEQNTWTPLVASISESVLYVATTLLLASRLHIYALPVGRAFASFIGPWILGYLLRRRIGSLGFREMWSSTIKISAASLVMAGFILMGSFLVSFISLPGFAFRVVALGLPTLTGSIGVGIALLALGVLDLSMLGQYGSLPKQWLSRLMVLTKLAPKPQ